MSFDIDSADSPPQDTLERFASDLRTLKLRAGDPTLLALSSRTGISKSVLSEAFSGKRLPTEKTVKLLADDLGADPEEWMNRRMQLDPRGPQRPPLVVEIASTPKPRLGRTALAVAATAAIAIGATSLVWWNVLQGREAAWAAQAGGPIGNDFLEVVDGVDPMQTECREDKVIADIATRHDEEFQIEMLYSNACMAVWGRVTRLDGKAHGNSIGFRIYPANDPESPRSQERSAPDVNSLYTPLLIEPDVDARVCGVAMATRGEEKLELGPPLCI